jgi:hypothetical protein
VEVLRHRAVTFLLAVAASRCADVDSPTSVVVHVEASLAPSARPALADLVADLARITASEVIVTAEPAPPCTPREVHVTVGSSPALAAQDYTIDETRCGTGHVVRLRGGGPASSQWAMYELLEALGVRYFHPERTLHPSAARWPAEPLAVRASPDVRRRSMHVHTTHPVELSAPLDERGLDMAGYQRRWIDWSVKQRQTLVDGWDLERVGTYAFDRGFPRAVGLNLLNAQQGRRPVLDPDDPRPEDEQLAAAIDAQLAPVPGLPAPVMLGVEFNPSEFTVVDERRTVERLGFIADRVAERWPGVEVWTINHGTAQPPGPVFGMRFYDLPALAPTSLGVSVHPLMLYDLDRPAPVYGNRDFHALRDWLIAEAPRRRIRYYPEASWWLTFDLPVPLYLAPATIEARDHDLQRLRPLLATRDDAEAGVIGHHLFTSGQEWGYWMVDYCTARMAWEVRLGWEGCLDHVVSALAEPDVLGRVLREVARRQARDLRDPDVLRMLVGSDGETELGARAGIAVHPLPPSPEEVVTWSDAEVAELRTRSLAPLAAMAADYDAWADAVAATLAAQDSQQAPWVREMRDGLRIVALRARHSLRIYEAVLAWRAGDAGAARAALRDAEDLTQAATVVVREREADYRYPPALQIAGDEAGSPGAVPNRTVYPYRVLSRTHRLYYWHRPDRQVAALLESASRALAPRPAGALRRIAIDAGAFHVTAPPAGARLDRMLTPLTIDVGHDDRGDLFWVHGRVVTRLDRTGSASAATDLVLEVSGAGGLTLHGAVLVLGEGDRVALSGELASDEIVERLAATGAVDAEGARRMVAGALGATVATLPARVPVAIEARGRAVP